MGGAENPVEEFVPFDIPLSPLDLTATFFNREK
jgi:hypothetical protein